MRNHIVYFEIYSKKMRATVLAKNEADAKAKIAEKIIFHKIAVDQKDCFNESMNVIDDFMDMVGMNKKK